MFTVAAKAHCLPQHPEPHLATSLGAEPASVLHWCLSPPWSYFHALSSRSPPRTSSCVWWGVLAVDGSLLGWWPLSETSFGHRPAHAAGHHGPVVQVKLWEAEQRTRWFYVKAKTFLFHSLFLSFPSPLAMGRVWRVVVTESSRGNWCLLGNLRPSQAEGTPGEWRAGCWSIFSS